MQDSTFNLGPPEENLLGLTDQSSLNESEAFGFATAELFLYTELDLDEPLDIFLIRRLHEKAFGHLYHWAGKWRTIQVLVGQITPPEARHVVQLMYQFLDTLNWKLEAIETEEDLIDCLAYAHYQFIYIHPFMNGNGRIGRMLTNLVALKHGYKPVLLGHQKGINRPAYIQAMRQADEGNLEPLKSLIRQDLASF